MTAQQIRSLLHLQMGKLRLWGAKDLSQVIIHLERESQTQA